MERIENGSCSVRFAVTAIIDLIGFSNQLEVTYRDLNSSIGDNLIKRLLILDNSIEFIKLQDRVIKDLFPKNYTSVRINDALIITMDLPDILAPSFGEIHKTTYEYTPFTSRKPSDFFSDIKNGANELNKFLCLISRLHTFVDREDKKNHHPGCKTIISTGFRRVFKDFENKEDAFSANFSFSNAYIADKSLKDHTFFVDSNVLRLCTHQKAYSLDSLIRCSLFLKANSELSAKSILKNDENKIVEGKEISIKLFRQNYLFHEVDPGPLTYIQVLMIVEDFFTKCEIAYEHIRPLDKKLLLALTSFDENAVFELRLSPLTIQDDLYDKIASLLVGRSGNFEELSLPSYNIDFDEYILYIEKKRSNYRIT